MKIFWLSRPLCLAVVLLLLVLSATSVHAQNQRKITLVSNKISIQDVFDTIRQQTSLTVFYTNHLLNDKERINVNFQRADLADVLDFVLKDKGLTWSINDKYIVLKRKPKESARTAEPVPGPPPVSSIRVQGLVSDEKGMPLSGVTIKLKNGPVSLMTDENGKYSIPVPDERAVLVFTHVGFAREERPVGKSQVLNVSLKAKDDKLDDIVIIGYGTAKKKDLTGSVSSVSKEALSERTLLSLADAIKGKAAGVQITQNDGTPGSENTIRIRGASSVSAASTPLYVVDGVLQDDINNINPGDIESIEVLKDASSTAIYGSRGANGVIIVTTRMGKAGKTQIDLYGITGFQKPAHLYKLMDAAQYAHEHYLASYVYSPASATDPNAPASVLTGYTYYRDTALGASTAGFWGVPQSSPFSTWKDFNSPDSVNTDWQKAMFQNSMVQEYRLSASGGSKDTKFAFLGGYLNQGGLLVYSNYRRINGRFNFQQNLSKDVILTSNISMTSSTTNGFINSTSALNGGVMSSPIINSMLQAPPTKTLSFTDVEDNTGVDGFITTNPYSIARYETNVRKSTDWITRLGLDWNINSNFMLRVTGTYTNTNPSTDSYYPKAVLEGAKYNGRALLSRGVTNRFLNENLLYYKGRIGVDHRINIMGGATFETSKYSLITAENQNYNVETLGVYGLSNGTVPIIPTYAITKWTMASFLSRAEYSYKDRYLLTMTMRADGSSRFSPSNKWGYFPSAAVAWKASEERFIKNIASVSSLKFRASVGQSGNTAIPSYLTLSTIATYFSPMDGVTPDYGVVVDRPENLALKWETTTQVDGGMDLGLFREKVNVTVDWYLKRTRDLLIQKVTPGYTGYRNTWTNLGSIQNSGLELNVAAIIFSGKRFNWNISANIGYNRSKAIDIGDQLNLAPGVVNGIGASAIIRNGQPLGQWYGYKTNGIFQSTAEVQASGLTAINGIAIRNVRPGTRRYIDINHDHVIDANDRTVLGQGQPTYTGGITNSIRYKNFNLNVVVQYSHGNKIYNANRAILETGRDTHNGTAARTGSWKPSLYDMTTGALVEAGNPSNIYRMSGSPEENLMLSDWIEDGSFIRLSDVTLSYQFNASKLRNIGVRGLMVFASGKNLWLSTKYSGYDPEVNTRQGGFGDLMPSLDFASYPRSRIFSFGMRAQF